MFTVHVPKLVPMSEINPVGYNPRTISPEKYEGLKESIHTEGFVEPLVIQKSGHRIIGGHQRYKAAKELSIEACVAPPDLPCIILDIDDERAKRLNIKLNRLRGEFDAHMLGELLIDLYDEPKLIPREEAIHLGFDNEDDVLKFMHLVEPPPPSMSGTEPKTFGKSMTLSLEFTSIDERDRIKKLLVERSKVENKKSGDIVASLLTPKPKLGKTPITSKPPKPTKMKVRKSA